MAKAQARTAAPVEEEVGGEIEVGALVVFIGYSEQVDEAERLLTENEVYPVVEVVTGDDGAVEAYVVELENPNFNAKKKEHPETNPKMLETEVLPSEVELFDGEEEGAGEEAAPVETKPAPRGKATTAKAEAAPAAKATTAKATTAKATATKPAGKATTAKAEAETKPAGKATSTKATSTKAAAKPAPKVEEEAPEIDPDAVPELENESEEVLELIGEVDNLNGLIEVAQGLEEQTAHNEFLLGGVLYHIKKDGGWKDLDERYAEKKGFNLFVAEHFNVDYRKAQYLVNIYIDFTQAGIEGPAEYIGRIGWTKASKISKLLNQPDTDVESLLQTAEENSVSELSEIIKEQFTVGGTGGTPGEKKKRVTLKFRYVEEEASAVEGIIHEAMEQFGLKEDQALLQILTDWHSMNAVESGKVGEVKEDGKPVAKTSGVKGGAKATATAKPAPRGKARA